MWRNTVDRFFDGLSERLLGSRRPQMNVYLRPTVQPHALGLLGTGMERFDPRFWFEPGFVGTI